MNKGDYAFADRIMSKRQYDKVREGRNHTPNPGSVIISHLVKVYKGEFVGAK